MVSRTTTWPSSVPKTPKATRRAWGETAELGSERNRSRVLTEIEEVFKANFGATSTTATYDRNERVLIRFHVRSGIGYLPFDRYSYVDGNIDDASHFTHMLRLLNERCPPSSSGPLLQTILGLYIVEEAEAPTMGSTGPHRRRPKNTQTRARARNIRTGKSTSTPKAEDVFRVAAGFYKMFSEAESVRNGQQAPNPPPPKAPTPPPMVWLSALGLKDGASLQEAEKAYRKLVREAHPDRPGGSAEKMRKLNDAIADARKHFGKT